MPRGPPHMVQYPRPLQVPMYMRWLARPAFAARHAFAAGPPLLLQQPPQIILVCGEPVVVDNLHHLLMEQRPTGAFIITTHWFHGLEEPWFQPTIIICCVPFSTESWINAIYLRSVRNIHAAFGAGERIPPRVLIVATAGPHGASSCRDGGRYSAKVPYIGLPIYIRPDHEFDSIGVPGQDPHISALVGKFIFLVQYLICCVVFHLCVSFLAVLKNEISQAVWLLLKTGRRQCDCSFL